MSLTFSHIMDTMHSIKQEIQRILGADFSIQKSTLGWILPYKKREVPKRHVEEICMLNYTFVPTADPDCELSLSIYVYADFFLHFNGDEGMIRLLKQPLEAYREVYRLAYDDVYKAEKFMERSKEELMAAAWHPKRVEKWVEAGEDLETL